MAARRFAVKIVQEIDETGPHILMHEPITRYTDSETKKRFGRIVGNSGKPKIKRTVGRRKSATPKGHNKSS